MYDESSPKICSYCLCEIDETNSVPEDDVERVKEKLFNEDYDISTKEAYVLSGICIKCYEAMDDRGEI